MASQSGQYPRTLWLVPRHVSTLDSYNTMRACFIQILTIYPTVRNACVIGDLPIAEGLLTREINTDGNKYSSYANRSFVMARKSDWDNALHDALKV